MYENTRAKVTSPDGETDLFELFGQCSSGGYTCSLLVCDSSRLCLENSNRWQRGRPRIPSGEEKSRRGQSEVITDFDFADDIALLSEEIQQAQELLSRVETSVGKVGLRMNASKTKYMSFNHNGNINIQTNDGTKLEKVSDFKYLGALMESSEKDVKVRKAAAWRACSKLNKIWKSTLPRGSNNDFLLLLWSLFCSMVARHGRSPLSSQKTLMDAILDSSEQYSMSTGSSI